MSRIRTIKPTFWSSGQVLECSPITRLLFVGLWNFCDASGRRTFSEKQIKAQIFPSDDFTVEQITSMLWELSGNGLIVVYRNGNNMLLEVTGWKHQKIDNETSSKLPGPLDDNSEIIQRAVHEDSPKDLGLRNKDLGKDLGFGLVARAPARERPDQTKKILNSILENEKPNAEQIAEAERYGINTNEAVEAEYEHFRDYNLVKGNQVADINAAWRRWLSKRPTDKPAAAAKPMNGHAVSPPAQQKMFIEVGTPQWNAWDEWWKKSNGGIGPPRDQRKGGHPEGGWWFPTPYPPNPG